MIDRRNLMMICCAALLTMCSGAELRAACTFAPQGDGRVSAILDARTFRLDDGREVRVAAIEVPDDIAVRGGEILNALIGGRDVTLHGPDDRPDRYGRQSAFVALKDTATLVQTGLLARGEALISAAPADKACADALLAAEATARAARRGIWAGSAALKSAETPGDILARLGRFTVVEGTVSSARLAGATFYVNFGPRWTRDFAVTISRRMMPSFEASGIDLKSLKDKRIRVRGWIERRGGLRIELSHPGQFEVIAASGTIKDDMAAKIILPKDEVK